jgi:hypothetical protein
VKGRLPPADAALFRSGRACLRAVLETKRPRRFLAPYYVCDAALAPARALGLEVVFYAVDRALSPLLTETRADDAVLVVDYFGLCGAAVSRAMSLPGTIIVDQTQALFAHGPAEAWRFTSARKWFGVPDGGFLWGPQTLVSPTPPATESFPAHLFERRFGSPAQAYSAYLSAEAAFDAEIAPISTTSRALLAGVDADFVCAARRNNFEVLHSELATDNEFEFEFAPDAVPFCYPLLPASAVSRETLAKSGIFVPRFWQDCLARDDPAFAWEKELSQRLLPLPLDHRYGRSDMLHVAQHVRHLIHQGAG